MCIQIGFAVNVNKLFNFSTTFVCAAISGYLLFKDFCENASEEPVPHLKFYEEVCIRFFTAFIVLWQIPLFIVERQVFYTFLIHILNQYK